MGFTLSNSFFFSSLELSLANVRKSEPTLVETFLSPVTVENGRYPLNSQAIKHQSSRLASRFVCRASRTSLKKFFFFKLLTSKLYFEVDLKLIKFAFTSIKHLKNYYKNYKNKSKRIKERITIIKKKFEKNWNKSGQK